MREAGHHRPGRKGTYFFTLIVPKMGQAWEGGDRMRANIEAERGRLCMTKTALCAELGITLKTYNGYIRGAAIPSDILERLSDITGCSIDYLLGRES